MTSPNIGILDPLGKFNNPLTNQPYKNIYNDPKIINETHNTYSGFATFWSNLPMYKQKTKEILDALIDNQVILITAGTGAGKTVLLPKYLLHIFKYTGKIGITNPKRIPSEENALFAAMHLDVKLGEQVGYRFKGKKKANDETNLLYCTDGYLVAKLKTDNLLSTFNGIIIDEAHERNTNIDLLLILLKDVIKKRPDFKLVIMSATVNEKLFIDYYKEFEFKHVHSEGTQLHPIKEYFIENKINKFDNLGNLANSDYVKAAIGIVLKIIKSTTDGAILVFFPSTIDLIMGCEQLQLSMDKRKILCQPLSGKSSDLEKEYAISSDKYKTEKFERKVVMGTEVVESSITISDLKYVIDCGLSNQQKYYADENLNALEKKYISKASHLQRKGRVGRTGPGECYNVFTIDEYAKFQDYNTSPILISDITQNILELFVHYVKHVIYPFSYKNIKTCSLANFLSKFIEIPHENYVLDSVKKLIALGALSLGALILDKDNNVYILSDIGKQMTSFNLKPEYSRMITASLEHNIYLDVCKLVAMLEIAESSIDTYLYKIKHKNKDTLKQLTNARQTLLTTKINTEYGQLSGDHFTLIKLFNEFDKASLKQDFCHKYYLNYRKLKEAVDEYKLLIKKVQTMEKQSSNNNMDNNIKILLCLVEGSYISIIEKQKKGEWKTCYPVKKSVARLDRFTYLTDGKDVNFCIYSNYKKIFNMKMFATVSWIPQQIIEQIKKSKLKNEYIKDCFYF